MKAIINLNIPEFQIGQEVKIYFSDTMMIEGMTEKQKTGHWIDNKVQTKLCNCSECYALSKVYSNYCPNCGAKMEGE